MGPTGPGDENQIESRWEGRARGRACGSYHAGDFEGLLPHLLLHVGALELDLVRRRRRRRGRRRGPRAHRLAVLGGGPERRLRDAPGPAPGLVGHSRRRGGAELPGTAVPLEPLPSQWGRREGETGSFKVGRGPKRYRPSPDKWPRDWPSPFVMKELFER